MAAVKVLVSGTFSTGKTTCAEAVCAVLAADRIPAVVALEPSRSCPAPLNEEQSLSTSLWLMGRLISGEIEAASDGAARVVLCAGGPPELLAHTDLLWDGGLVREASDLIALAKAWQPSYDLVFWSRLDPVIPILDDGVRSRDPRYRELIERRVGEALSILGVRARELPNDGAERADLILDAVRGLLDRSGR